MKIQVQPLVELNEIKLGWKRKETYNYLGKPIRIIDNIEYYKINVCLVSIHYNSIEKVEYIELSNPKNNNVEIVFKNVNIFNTKAEDLITFIVSKLKIEFDKENNEIPYSFIFNEIEMSLWRPTIPENKFDNDGLYFETVGIGSNGYYSQNND